MGQSYLAACNNTGWLAAVYIVVRMEDPLDTEYDTHEIVAKNDTCNTWSCVPTALTRLENRYSVQWHYG